MCEYRGYARWWYPDGCWLAGGGGVSIIIIIIIIVALNPNRAINLYTMIAIITDIGDSVRFASAAHRSGVARDGPTRFVVIAPRTADVRARRDIILYARGQLLLQCRYTRARTSVDVWMIPGPVNLPIDALRSIDKFFRLLNFCDNSLPFVC